MTAFDRKLKRNMSKKMVKEIKNSMDDVLAEAMKSKMDSFSKIPDNCTACEKPFDKKNREQVFSWMMQIHKEENIYNLFCPECYGDYFDTEEEVITNE